MAALEKLNDSMQSETRYREMLESTPDAYYEVDLSGAITYYSSGLADVLGYPEDELLGLSNRDYADAENVHQIYEAFHQVYQTGQPAKAILMHTIRKDGTPQILETSIALRHDTAGKVIGFRGIARDVTGLITEREAAQTASARSEARYRDILESIKDGYYEVDLDGSIIMINKQAADVFGYPHAQLLGMNFRQFTSPETAEISYKAFNSVFRTGEPIEGLTHPIITADGEERYVEVSISLVKDANNHPTGFRGIVRNVTGRIRDEETLRQSEERYRTILDSIEDGYYEADLDGNFTFMNDQLCQVIGYPREELMGKNYREYATPETAERLFDTFNRVYKTREPVKGFVWDAIGADGRIRHLETFVLPRYDQTGRVIGFRGVGRDITQRIQAEEALAEALIDQERIADQLATVAKVSTAVSTILDPQEMLQAVVDQVKKSFNLYHVHAYLLNEAGDTLELVAGAGTVGQQMVQEGHSIPLAAEQSLVARAARRRTGVIVHNVRKDPHFLPHPLLPETRSEMAVPMIVGGQVLGVLDLQADTTNRFTQRYVNIQTTLAAQIAVALQNARLFAQAQQQTAELQETTALLDQIIEILPVGLFMKEAQNLRFVRWNKANEVITGLKYHDVIGKNDYDLFTKEQADFFTEKDRQVLIGNTIVEIPEETIATPHRGQRLLHTRKLPILGADGVPRYLLGVSEDITERKEAQESLRKSEQAILESLRMQQILHEANLELSQVESLDELYKQAVHLGKMRLNLERFALFIYDEARDCFTGTYGIDRDGNPCDERGPEFDIAVPDVVQFFRDIKQRLMIREDCELWDHGVVVGHGWNITAPLRLGNKLAGLLFTDNLLSQQPLLPHLPDLIIAYSNIIANLIERKQAEESVAMALAESNRLYEMSARLNAAASVNEILEAVVVPVAGRGIMSATLFTLEVDANGRPEWMELVAVWNRPGSVLASLDFPIGTRLYLPDLPTSAQWIDAPDELVLYEDVEQDDTLDQATRELFQMAGVKASATLPLHTGNKWVGVINLSWNEIKSFTQDDRRIFHTLTGQTAIIMNNQLLFKQTQKRVVELAAVAEVGAAITTIRDVDVLLQRVVDLTKERFALYHVHIYLLDESGRNLVLTSGAGDVGRKMVAEGRIIPINQAQSLIARAVRKRQGIIANNVIADADFLPHPLLPDTRSEMAVPMIVADEVLGVLDIQSSQKNHFSEGDIQIQITLAAQIGVALQNARSFARSETAVKELQEVTRRLRREGWESYAQASGRNGWRYTYDQKEVKALLPATAVNPRSGEQKTPTTPTLSYPLQVQGETIGQLMLAEPSVVDEDAQDIMTAVAERLSAHIENLRLSEQTEQARQQAEKLFRGSAALNTAQSYEEVLAALRQNSIMGHASVNNVSLNYFDRAWENNQKPDWVDVLTRWSRLPEEAVSSRYALAHFPSADLLLHPDAPTIIEDVAMDKRMDENLRSLYKDRFQAKSTIFVPLVVGSQWVGFFNAIYADKMQFSDDEIRRLTTLGQQAAVTIQSIRLFAQAEARAHELAILNEMVSELTTMLAVEPILEAIYRFSSRLVDTTNFYIAMHNKLTNEITFPIAVEENKQVRWDSRPYGNGMTEYLLRTGQPLFVEDGLEKWLRSQGVDSIGNPSQSWMGVPLRPGNEVVGVVALQSLQPRFFTREQFDLLNAMANQAAIAIQNARQFQHEQARAQRQQMLREIAAKVRSSADVDTIMRTAVQEIGQALGRQTFVYLDTTAQTKVGEDAYHEPDK
ncbi:MAG: PAS domain S-box protein [Ardenticatenaceae bacterium]|nr:PAS domain S-box protein [Ardenticatenaceae bacterium]